jgi:hypothetical protein
VAARNREKSEKSKNQEITLHSFTLKTKQHFHILLNLQCPISQEYSDDEDIAPYYDNMHDSDGFAAQSQEEYDDHAGEGPVDIDGCNGDGQSVSSSSNIEEDHDPCQLRNYPPNQPKHS